MSSLAKVSGRQVTVRAWTGSIIHHEYSPSKPAVETTTIPAFVKYTEADPGVVGPEAYTIFGALFRKNNTKLGT